MRHIAVRLWLGMMALVVVLLIMLWTFQIAFFQSGYLQSNADILTANAYNLATMLQNEERGALDYIDELNDSYNTSVLLLDPYNIPIYAAGEYSGSLLRDCIKKAESVTKQAPFSDYVVRERFALRYVRVGIALDGGGVLYLIKPVTDVGETLKILKGQFIYLTIVMSSAAIIVAAILSTFFTRPISKLNTRAALMAKGDLHTPFTSDSKDEIGELTSTLEQLRKSQLQLDVLRRELIANVTHELRTPLAIIRGFAETIKDVTHKNPQKMNQQLGAIIDESMRLEKMVNEILNYSQLQSGVVSFQMERCDLTALCERVHLRMCNYFEKSNILLYANIQDAVLVHADESKLEQVLFNLLANAYNHSPEYTQVSIVLKKVGEFARIEIQDQGEGIPAEDLPHIWDRYYRAGLKDRQDRMGSGLGLAVCKSILEEHDARFGVESKVDVGSIFAFELSLCK